MGVITEPATLITDYLLAGFGAALGWRLWARSAAGAPRRWWAYGFMASAVAGLAGGTVHGFVRVMSEGLTGALWILAIEALVAAGLAVVLATAAASGLVPAWRRAAAVTAVAAYGAYAVWIAANPQFVYAIAAYGSALLLLAVAAAARRSRADGFFLAGVAVSGVAAAVQQSGWSLHEHFNHNDLFHVVQALAIWLLYRGALGAGQPTAAPGRRPPAGVTPSRAL